MTDERQPDMRRTSAPCKKAPFSNLSPFESQFFLPHQPTSCITCNHLFLNQGGKGYYFRAMLVSYLVHSLVDSFIFIALRIVFHLIKKGELT
jgi:hypothetical protein